MKLYEIEFGVYPRRVSIYLAEKGIADIERIAFDLDQGWPPKEMSSLSPLGTVPILQVNQKLIIRSSIAILEYLEERYPTPPMIGRTPAEKARTREFVALADEATTMFGFWVRKVSPLFRGREEHNRDAGRLAAGWYYRRLREIDTLMHELEGDFLAGDIPTIADCITYSTIQFAYDLYDVPYPEDARRLMNWFHRFADRPSSATAPFPVELRVATQGLPALTWAD